MTLLSLIWKTSRRLKCWLCQKACNIWGMAPMAVGGTSCHWKCTQFVDVDSLVQGFGNKDVLVTESNGCEMLNGCEMWGLLSSSLVTVKKCWNPGRLGSPPDAILPNVSCARQSAPNGSTLWAFKASKLKLKLWQRVKEKKYNEKRMKREWKYELKEFSSFSERYWIERMWALWNWGDDEVPSDGIHWHPLASSDRESWSNRAAWPGGLGRLRWRLLLSPWWCRS